MQSFELTILGCSSATPTSQRNPTSQLLNVSDRYFLIDCGEAAQIQLRRFKIKFQRINHIFISHLHGDHYFGLMGLLSSMHLLGRTNELHLYSHPGLKEIIELQHKHSHTMLNYSIVYHSLHYDKSERLFEDDKLTVDTIILNHRIPCCGFIFREKPHPRHVIKEKIAEYKIPLSQLKSLKEGKDYLSPEGLVISNEELTLPGEAPRSYAYCSDTCYEEGIIDQVKNIDLLYHEATFMEDLASRAKETFHTTTIQAATVALRANVKKLIIGHFSARYKDAEPLLQEAKSVFPHTVLAQEGEKYTVSCSEF